MGREWPIPDEIPCGFDPDKTDNPAFSDYTGKCIYSCVKLWHITDQYFNDQVRTLADKVNKSIEEYGYLDYDRFAKIVEPFAWKGFGMRCTEHEHLVSPQYLRKELDPNFWKQVFEFITHKRELKLKYIQNKEE